MGYYPEAEADYEKAREIFPIPVDVDGTLKLADQYTKRGAFRNALEEYNKILQWDPVQLKALNDRANPVFAYETFPGSSP